MLARTVLKDPSLCTMYVTENPRIKTAHSIQYRNFQPQTASRGHQRSRKDALLGGSNFRQGYFSFLHPHFKRSLSDCGCSGVTHRTGTGIFFTMYSHTASMLYFSCAEMGTTGAASAMVPWMNACMGEDRVVKEGLQGRASEGNFMLSGMQPCS